MTADVPDEAVRVATRALAHADCGDWHKFCRKGCPYAVPSVAFDVGLSAVLADDAARAALLAALDAVAMADYAQDLAAADKRADRAEAELAKHTDCVPREPEQERYNNAIDSLADTAQRLYLAEERAKRAEEMLDRCDEARQQVIAERDRLRNDNRKLATRDPDVRTVYAYEAGRDDEREQAEADNRRLREAAGDALERLHCGHETCVDSAVLTLSAALDGGEPR